VLLLAHQPKDAHQLGGEGRIRLQVSGHTHGGQIWPFGLVAKRDQGFLAGLYRLGHRQLLYVSQGACYWGLPFRLGTNCELSLLRLVPP
jgi:predicted MPP superfamily phosphohydrolase